MDRIDLYIEVQPVDRDDLTSQKSAEPSKTVATRVAAARSRQLTRFESSAGRLNKNLTPEQMKKDCLLDNETAALAKQSIQRLELSARSYSRILKVARTIADLDDSVQIKLQHFAEALQYRGGR